jgi:hypothetical protein
VFAPVNFGGADERAGSGNGVTEVDDLVRAAEVDRRHRTSPDYQLDLVTL